MNAAEPSGFTSNGRCQERMGWPRTYSSFNSMPQPAVSGIYQVAILEFDRLL